MSELLVRTVAGLVLILVALGARCDGGYYFAVLVAAVATAMFYEWTRHGARLGRRLEYRRLRLRAGPGAGLAVDARPRRNGLALVLWVFIVTWATDIGAYFAGRAIGGAKLAPSISPGKTWRACTAGWRQRRMLGGAVGLGHRALSAAARAGALLAIAAQAGDLFESGMKRRAGVKDSGRWLPGHGGLFDRLDGLVSVAVLAAPRANGKPLT